MVSLIIGFIALFLLIVLMLVAIRIGVNKEKKELAEEPSVIHASGIYSVVRKSPRADLLRKRPAAEDIRKYLSGINVDSAGASLSDRDKERLACSFFNSIDENISQIEQGDRDGVEFYYYDFEGDDPVCARYVDKAQFVTREDIFRHSILIPPFHLGCACRIKAHHGSENLRDTTELRMRPFLTLENPEPRLPDWTQTARVS